ncbi:hypothetical protein QQ008_24715 [Fulvivirgaceae bacterium BMA10]|uniref:DUF4203 domain-containing protein n=1 Tax=Splendidivirga corallicola TaxID=3051826 RepID=A0ABT8KYD6_9BACT|nr:hypothetical protein [Fulvivirgaceae bacterium BMA10]
MIITSLVVVNNTNTEMKINLIETAANLGLLLFNILCFNINNFMALKTIFIGLIIGITAGLLTAFIIPADFEIFVWITIIILIALYAVKSYNNRLFVKTFMNALFTGIVITSIHLIFLDHYLMNHPDEQKLLDSFGIHSDRIGLLIIAPIYWIVLGLLTGGLALLWQRFHQRKTDVGNN